MVDEKESRYIVSTPSWSMEVTATSPKRAKDKAYYVRYKRSTKFLNEKPTWEVKEVEPNFIVKLWRKFYDWQEHIYPLWWLKYFDKDK